ncbi:sid-1c [Ramazzottius varieornatus]|uniref:Sid-1c n=1 Tax=Ramazzottius varieornatus TaxID=947166 RepID=A0A1D1UGJ4_RAMVA|nr:sid-1c [Ramazzottius varieornatus]
MALESPSGIMMRLLPAVCVLLLGLLPTKGQYSSNYFRPYYSGDQPRAPPVTYSEFNQTYADSISSASPRMFSYRQNTVSGAVKVQVWSTSATIATPILVIVKRHSSVLSWQVPLILEEDYEYLVTNRTLCPSRNHVIDSNGMLPAPVVENFFVEVLTLSDTAINFFLRVETYPTFIKDGDASFLIEASPSAPQFVQYNMRTDSKRVLVQLRAEEGQSFCGYLSIQSVRCPVGDLESELRLDGRFQTITSQGAIEVDRGGRFKEGSFYIVVVVQPQDYDCESAKKGILGSLRPRSLQTANEISDPSKTRRKVVRITVTETVSSKTIAVAVIVPILVYLVFFVVAMILLQTGFRTWKAILCRDLDEIELPTCESQWRFKRFWDKNIRRETLPCQWEPSCYPTSRVYQETLNRQRLKTNDNGEVNRVLDLESQLQRRLSFTDTDMPRVDTEVTLQEGGSGRPETRAVPDLGLRSRDPAIDPRRPTLLRMSSINRTTSEKLTRIATEYSFTLTTIFVFYSLPVLQLVMTHQGLLLLTGNEDLCFYNFSCANRLGVLSDFNHIISNAGYIILGILFTLQVRRRAIFTAALRLDVPDAEDYYGIPSQFGLFYGMGLALIMEGLMSSFYHVCPSYNNFQFDTSFMYLITGLLILKLYHSRHPDILPRSFVAYSTFAGIIFIAVLGVVLKEAWYWIAFSVIHGLLALVIGIQLLYVGYLEASPGAPIKAFKSVRFTGCSEYPRSRICLAALIFSVNMAFAIIGPVMRATDFASHLLFVLQANLMIYAGFYMVMKMQEPKEKISLATISYFLLALPAWIAGMYFFTARLTNWEVSPAMSREGNKECFFFNFYDEHDVWHMLSAFGLYFTFMMLFTLDDDLASVPRDQITVF